VLGSPARAIVRFRFLIIAFWVVIAAFAIPRASHVHDVLQVEGSTAFPTESRTAQTVIRHEFPEPLNAFFVIAVEGPTPIDSPAYREALLRLENAARAQPFISLTISPLRADDPAFVSRDRRATFIVAAVADAHADSSTDLTPAFRRAIHSVAERLPNWADYNVQVTGGPPLDFDARTVTKEDVDRAEAQALPLVAIVLVVAFGALVAAALPIIIGLFVVPCALALVHLAASFMPMSVFVLTIVTMIGLGVGIDYSLLIVTRFREELNRGLRRRDAAVRTIQTAGRAVVTSGLTVLVGFGSLYLAPITETRSVAVGGVIVVSLAVLLSVTLLPAVLAILGRAIDMPRGLAKRLAWYHAPTGWERWARWLGNHPWRALLLGLSLAALITWPLAHIRIGLPRSDWFPSGTESAAGAAILERIGTRALLQPVTVIVQAPEGEKIVGTRYLRGLRRLQDSILADPRVSDIRSVVALQPGLSMLQYSILYSDLERARERHGDALSSLLSPDGRTTRMTVLLHDSTTITSSMDVVRRIRAIRDEGVAGLDSVTVLLSGFQAASVDLQDELLRRFPLLVTVILVITAVAMFVAFQSVLVPLKAVVMNCLSVAGAFGLIVLVFQEGVGGGLFRLDGPTGAIYVLVPVLVFAVVFGLSMDYEVFLLARIKEAFDRSGRNSQATMEGLSATASVITSAAAIMMIVFGTFAFSRLIAVQLFGFGLAVAVFLDATLVRMVLVPAFMHIAGSWNWWPGVRRAPEEPRRTPEGSAAA
jgi:putative drug exporter of the RND superfamily